MSSPRFTMRRAQRVAEHLAVVDRHLVERDERVDRLGDRDAHARLAQQVREVDDLPLHRPAPAPASAASPSWRAPRAAPGAAGAAAGFRRLLVGLARDQPAELGVRLLDVALVLEDHVQRVLHELLVEAGRVQRQQRPRPVERLADRRRLLEVELAEPLHHADELLGEPAVHARHLGLEDAPLELGVGEVDVEVQAAALQRVAHLARVVRGEEHDRLGASASKVPISGTLTWKSDSTSSRNASNSGSDLSTSSISSRFGSSGGDRAQQRPRHDEAAREEHAVLRADAVGRVAQRGGPGHHLGELLLQDLRVEQLLRVLPLVERLGLVEPLVALEADQRAAGRASRRPSPARSCRRRPGPRRAPASRAWWPGTPPSRCSCRRCSPALPSRFWTSSTDSNKGPRS